MNRMLDPHISVLNKGCFKHHRKIKSCIKCVISSKGKKTKNLIFQNVKLVLQSCDFIPPSSLFSSSWALSWILSFWNIITAVVIVISSPPALKDYSCLCHILLRITTRSRLASESHKTPLRAEEHLPWWALWQWRDTAAMLPGPEGQRNTLIFFCCHRAGNAKC